jgi:hypothetical protein
MSFLWQCGSQLAYLADDTQTLFVSKPNSLQLIVNEGELGAVAGEGWEHSRHPELRNVTLR